MASIYMDVHTRAHMYPTSQHAFTQAEGKYKETGVGGIFWYPLLGHLDS